MASHRICNMCIWTCDTQMKEYAYVCTCTPASINQSIKSDRSKQIIIIIYIYNISFPILVYIKHTLGSFHSYCPPHLRALPQV